MTRNPAHAKATCIGVAALTFWGLSAFFAVSLKELPLFQNITIVLLLGFLFSLWRITYLNKWKDCRKSHRLWAVGLLCIPINLITYVIAFKLIPAAQADLVYYLWPIMVLLLAGMLPNEKFTLFPVLGGLLGLVGVSLLFCFEPGFYTAGQNLFLGVLAALISGLSWAIYTLVSRNYNKTPPELIGLFCGFGAIITLFLHLSFEEPVIPTFQESSLLFVWGVGTHGISLPFWDHGVRKGNFKFLSVISYLTPVLSIAVLIFTGYTSSSWKVLLAATLVVLGSYVSTLTRAREKDPLQPK